VALDISTELVSFEGPPDLPGPARVFRFPAMGRAPEWAAGAWDALCHCETELRDRALERSFYHASAMLQGHYDELGHVFDSIGPKVVVCAATQPTGGAALVVAARARGVGSLLLQHGMSGSNSVPLLADAMLMWGSSSVEIMAALGLPRAKLLTVGSPRHDSMRPSGTETARMALLRAVGRPDRPTFVFFSNGHDLEHT